LFDVIRKQRRRITTNRKQSHQKINSDKTKDNAALKIRALLFKNRKPSKTQGKLQVPPMHHQIKQA